MTTTPALTGRDIGEAENAIRALLDRLLDEAGLSFPSGRSCSPSTAPARSSAASWSGARSTVSRCPRRRPIRQAVARLTVELYGDLPAADLEATHRTLAEVTRRANARLAAGGWASTL